MEKSPSTETAPVGYARRWVSGWSAAAQLLTLQKVAWFGISELTAGVASELALLILLRCLSFGYVLFYIGCQTL